MPTPVFNSDITQSFARYFTTAQDEFKGGTLFGVTSDEVEYLCENENVKFYQTEDACSNGDDFYFIAQINDPEYEVKEEYNVNGFGKEKLKSRVCIPRMSFSTQVDTYVRGKLYETIGANEEMLVDFETTWTGYRATNILIETEEKIVLEGGILWYMTISFLLPDVLPTTGTTPCCRANVYAEAPYNSDCPPEPENPELCDLMSIELAESGGNINLTINDPFGSPQSAWTFYPAGGGSPISLGTNLTSVMPPGFGIIKVVVTVGGCKKNASYSYLDPCTGFTVSASNTSGVLTANVDAAHTPVDSYQWSYSEDGVSYSALGSSNTQIASEGAGYYKVTVVNGECRLEAIVNVSEGAICELEGEITKEGNVLTFESESLDIVGYQWYVDTGEGSVLIVDATLESYTATETGYYTVEVELENGCIVPFSILHIMCADCATFTVTFSQDGNSLTAVPEGCGSPTYQWWAVNIDGTKDMLPNVTDTMIFEDDGLYFSVVCCAECDPVVSLISFNGGDFIITNSKLDNDFNWA